LQHLAKVRLTYSSLTSPGKNGLDSRQEKIKTQNKIKILLADDHQVVIDTLNDMLSQEDDILVVGSETDGLKAVNSALRLQPDIVVLDIFMPGYSGHCAIEAIRQKLPSQRILVLTISERMEDLYRALRYGAQGYILKRDSIRDIVKAVRNTADSQIVISNRMILRIINDFRQNQGDWENLNETDRQILSLCESGLSILSIAERLEISVLTVRHSIQFFLAMVSLRLQNSLRSGTAADFSHKEY
jgi:two-component system, NarL family, nitrate/nitrite response regulator NarL